MLYWQKQGYVGEDVESILTRLLAADYDVEKQNAESYWRNW
jgi:ATP-dependent protease Clp ATPase subunit